MTAAGQIKVKKGVISKGRHTKDSEEPRIKYTLINNTWLFARSRFTSRDWVQTLQRDSFQMLSTYILGPKVKGLESAEISGVKTQPEWSTVIMPYGKEMRKKMYKLTREGTSNGLVQAMRVAISCEETRTLHFTTPFTQQNARQKDGCGRRHSATMDARRRQFQQRPTTGEQRPRRPDLRCHEQGSQVQQTYATHPPTLPRGRKGGNDSVPTLGDRHTGLRRRSLGGCDQILGLSN